MLSMINIMISVIVVVVVFLDNITTCWILAFSLPRDQNLAAISMNEKGIVMRQSVRSEMARLMIKRFLGVLIEGLRITAIQTSPFPIVPIAINRI